MYPYFFNLVNKQNSELSALTVAADWLLGHIHGATTGLLVLEAGLSVDYSTGPEPTLLSRLY